MINITIQPNSDYCILLENTSKGHHKFYEMKPIFPDTGLTYNDFTARYGKIGTIGKTTTYSMLRWNKILTSKFKKAASNRKGIVHVVPSKDGWSIKKEGSIRSSAIKSTKNSAINAAKKIKSAERVVVHKKDGSIQRNFAKS